MKNNLRNKIRSAMVFGPAVMLLMTLSWSSAMANPGNPTPTPTPSLAVLLPAAPDLQVAEMKWWPANCTMYYRIVNNGGASGKFRVWVNFYPKSKEVMTIPTIAAKTSIWVQQSMLKYEIQLGSQPMPPSCGVFSVEKVQVVANARYLYKYVSNGITFGTLMVGDLIPKGTPVPTGWMVAEPLFSETNMTNNELVVPTSSLATSGYMVTTYKF